MAVGARDATQTRHTVVGVVRRGEERERGVLGGRAIRRWSNPGGEAGEGDESRLNGGKGG